MSKPARILYSEEEKAIVRQLYPHTPKEEIMAALPGRPWGSISSLASDLRVCRGTAPNYTRAWSAEHEALLHEHYPTKGARFVAELVGRPWRTVLSKAGHAKLTRIWAGRIRKERTPRPPKQPKAPSLAPRRGWSEADIALLRERYPLEGGKGLAAVLGRPALQINDKAHRLEIKYANPQGRPSARTEAEKRAARLVKRLAERHPKPKKAKPVAKVAKPKPAPKPVVVVPEPVKRSPLTPLLNARVEQRRLADKQREQKPKPYVTAAEIKALGANHPARWAYTRAAHAGPAAATEAFYAAMQQHQQAA